MTTRPSLLLPRNIGITQAVDEARFALSAFFKLEHDESSVRSWLEGPYFHATRFCPRPQSLTAREIVPAIGDAQRRAALVIQAAAGGAEELVKVLSPVVHVRPVHDHFGGKGYVPFHAVGSSLLERAVALAMADYLTRPDDFLACNYASGASGLRRVSNTFLSPHVAVETRPEVEWIADADQSA